MGQKKSLVRCGLEGIEAENPGELLDLLGECWGIRRILVCAEY